MNPGGVAQALCTDEQTEGRRNLRLIQDDDYGNDDTVNDDDTDDGVAVPGRERGLPGAGH